MIGFRAEFELARRVRGWITSRRLTFAVMLKASTVRISRNPLRDSPDVTGSTPRDRGDSPLPMGSSKDQIDR